MSPPRSPGPPWLLSRRAFIGLATTATLATASGRVRAGAGAQLGMTRAAVPPLSPSALDAVTRVAIHPGIGITRVGNSADAFYLGPEVPGALPPPGTHYRDAAGAVARQAARFRIYGYDAAGNVVGEITAADATIDWHVHLANGKAAWYRFSRAMDIPEAAAVSLRNHTVRGTARAGLVADAGLHSTSEGTPVELTATAMGLHLLLGELLTDAEGRLIVLPGRGRARSWTGLAITTFANNDGWLDDIADGPVTATVTLGARTLRAESAWVASGPPNYAPGLATGWRTMYDLLEDTWVSSGLASAGATVSFRRHILPLFVRLANLQWVNAGILRDLGWHSPRDLSDPAFLTRLADASPGNRSFRTSWANRFRNIDSEVLQPTKLPPMLGDAAAFPVTSPRQWIGPTRLQRHRLKQWAAGQFVSDGITTAPVAARLEALPVRRQPASLDRAAVEGCLAEAFDPGCELPWTMRHAIMWRAPYRLKVRSQPEARFGSLLTPAEAVSPSGPLNGSFPGSLTRWMALPWMTDTVDCLSGYQPTVDRYLDTFWPARVPNQVLTQADYKVVMDTSASLTTRTAAFRRRRLWLRSVLTSDHRQSLNRMVARWYRLGFVVARPGPTDGQFPARFAVEVARTLAEPLPGAAEPVPRLMPSEPGNPPGAEDAAQSR
jgi:hypothetical protein